MDLVWQSRGQMGDNHRWTWMDTDFPEGNEANEGAQNEGITCREKSARAAPVPTRVRNLRYFRIAGHYHFSLRYPASGQSLSWRMPSTTQPALNFAPAGVVWVWSV